MNQMPAQKYWWKKFRVVKDDYQGYEVQYRHIWWLPWKWKQQGSSLSMVNTHKSLQCAWNMIDRLQNNVIDSQ